MGLLDHMLNTFRPERSDGESPGDRTVLIDAAGLLHLHQGQKVTPKVQIDLLQRLSRTSQAEQIPLHVFFEGKPLNKVGDGEKFDELTVYFVDTAADLPERIGSVARQERKCSAVTVVSDTEAVQAQADAGIQVMRTSTFRKMLEGGGGRSRRRNSGGEGSGNRPRRGGRGRGRAGKDGGTNEGGDQNEDASASRKPRRPRKKEGNEPQHPGHSDAHDVSDLIDLVD